MRISDWSSDVCSSDLGVRRRRSAAFVLGALRPTVLIPISHDLFGIALRQPLMGGTAFRTGSSLCPQERDLLAVEEIVHIHVASPSTCQGYGKMRLFSHCPRVEFRSKSAQCDRSEEHTSELQSLMRISYAVFCLKKKKKHKYANRNAQNRETHVI